MAIYIPVLKTKTTSFKALQALKPSSKEQIIPVLEIVPDTEIDLAKNLSKYWVQGSPIYLDFLFLDGDENLVNIITRTIQSCLSVGIDVIPVWGPERTPDYLAAIKQLSHDGIKKIAFRFPESIFSPKIESKIIKRAFAELDNVFSEKHVFLDLEDISSGQAQYYAAIALLSQLYSPSFSVFGCIAGAFPNSTQLLEYKGRSEEIPRYDFELWKQLKASGESFASNLCYGDYTIRDIELPFSGHSTSIIPTLRYTKESTFYIQRGISHKKHMRGMYQFNDLCRELIQKSFYRGPNFSDGDRIIHEKGTQLNSAPGNPATWAQIGVNQHIEFVVQQISQVCAE